MRMEPDWDLVSSELESHGELGSDQEGVHGRRDHAPEQRWLLGQLCLSALPTQHFLGSEGTGSPTTAFAAHTISFMGTGATHFLHFSGKMEVWRGKWFQYSVREKREEQPC